MKPKKRFRKVTGKCPACEKVTITEEPVREGEDPRDVVLPASQAYCGCVLKEW